MTSENRINVDPSSRGVYKVGGISLFVAGVIPFLLLLLVIILQQTIPVPALEILEAPSAPTAWFLLAALGELLLMPGGLGLYLSLKDVKKTHMLIATSLWILATPMFLASRGLIIALSQISARYLDTTNETMKAAYLASAELAIETQSIFSYMALILLSVASIIIGSVMLKGVYGRVTGILAIAAGILTLFTPFEVIIEVPFLILFAGIILGAAWQISAGAKLYRLGQKAFGTVPAMASD
jgi:hypothetical protein